MEKERGKLYAECPHEMIKGCEIRFIEPRKPKGYWCKHGNSDTMHTHLEEFMERNPDAIMKVAFIYGCNKSTDLKSWNLAVKVYSQKGRLIKNEGAIHCWERFELVKIKDNLNLYTN